MKFLLNCVTLIVLVATMGVAASSMESPWLIEALADCQAVREGTAASHRAAVINRPAHQVPFTIGRGELRAGCASGDLDIPIGCPVAGYSLRAAEDVEPHRDPSDYAKLFSPAEGTYSRLLVRALALSAEDNTVILISVESFSLPARLHDDLYQRLSDLGFPQTNLIMSATNTFSGPGAFTDDLLFELENLDMFDQRVYDRILEELDAVVRRAISDLQPAAIGFGSVTNDQISRNHRDHDLDVEIGIMKLTDATETTLAVVYNFPVQGSALQAENLLLSGDCIGIASRIIETTLGDSTPALFLNGALGDVSPQRTGFSGVEWVAARLAATVLDALPDIEVNSDVRLSATARVVELPEPYLRPYFMDDNYPPEFTISLSGLVHESTRLHALRINDRLLLTIPGLPVASIGLELKNMGMAFPEFNQVFVCGMTNDHLGYILPYDDYWEGGYEAYLAVFGPEFHVVVVESALEMAMELGDSTPTPTATPSGTAGPSHTPSTSTPTPSPTPTPQPTGSVLPSPEPTVWLTPSPPAGC